MNLIDRVVMNNSLRQSEEIIGKMIGQRVQVVQVTEPDGETRIEVRTEEKVLRKVKL